MSPTELPRRSPTAASEEESRTDSAGSGYPRPFGRFVLKRKIGQGGMGVVYEAWEPKLQRHVALKTLRLEHTDQAIHERFEREARIAATLDHPNVVHVLEAGEVDEVLYFTMPLVHGLSLDKVITHLHGTSRGPVPGWLAVPPDRSERIDLLLRWFEGALRGLQYAHRRGIVHRDLKPENLILDANTELLRIVDFGLARVASLATLTKDQSLLGTVAYMAPEQVAGGGGSVDHRADLYAMGCTLYRALENRLPYAADSVGGYLRKITSEPPDPPSDLPDDLARILLRTLEKRPDDRYPDADAFRTDIEKYRRRESIPQFVPAPAIAPDAASVPAAAPVPAPAATPLPAPKRPWVTVRYTVAGVAVAGVMVLAVALLAGGMIRQWLVGSAPNPHAIVVLPFEDQSAAAVQQAGFGRWFAQAVTNNLQSMAPELVKPLPEGSLAGVDPDAIASRTGAGQWLRGTLRLEQETITASFRVHDVVAGSSRGNIVRTRNPDLGTGLSTLALSLASDVVAHLGRAQPKQYDFIDDLVGGPRMQANGLSRQVLDAIHRHEVTNAVDLSALLIEELPEEYEAWVLRAYSLLAQYQRGRLETTREALLRSLEELERRDEEAPYGEMFRGLLDFYSGRPQGALDHLSPLLARGDLTPRAQAWILRNHANVLSDLGRTADAVQELERACTLDPFNGHALLLLSKARGRIGRFADAVSPAQQAVSVDPSADAYRTLSLALKRAGRLEESLEAITKACGLDPAQEICAARALRLQQLGRPDEALEQARLAASMPPTPVGLYNLCCFHAIGGRPKEALHWLRLAVDTGYASKTIESDPDLASLRGRPEFEALVADVQKRTGSPRPTPSK